MHESGNQLFPVSFTVSAAHLAMELYGAFGLPEKIGDSFVVVVSGTAAVASVVVVLSCFPGTPGQEDPGIRTEGAVVKIGEQGPHAETHGSGDAGSFGEPAVIMNSGIQSHDATHAGTADGGAFPEGNGAVFPVDHRLDFIDDPVHGGFTLGIKLAKPAFGRIGHIFAEPFVAFMAAFNTNQDHGFFPAQEKFLHAPGLAIGGILVQEKVVAVKEIHDRIVFLGVVIVFRQPDVQHPTDTFGTVNKVAFYDHKRFLR